MSSYSISGYSLSSAVCTCVALVIFLAVHPALGHTSTGSTSTGSTPPTSTAPPHAIALTLEASKVEYAAMGAGSASAGAPKALHSRTVLTVTIANRGDVRAGIFEPICFEGNEEVAPHPSDQVKLKTKPLNVEI